MALTDLADAARKSGLPVVEVSGWKSRGRSGSFAPRGVLIHHTATAANVRDDKVVDLLVKGRSDLPGPLCQLGLGRDGTVYVIAAGRANHAGRSNARQGVPAGDGNSLWLGIEAFNSGNEGWSDAQLSAYFRLCAALCDHYGWPRDRVAAHGETSVTGKWDPGVGGRLIDMSAFRRGAAAATSGGTMSDIASARIMGALPGVENGREAYPRVLDIGDGGYILEKIAEVGAKLDVLLSRDDGLDPEEIRAAVNDAVASVREDTASAVKDVLQKVEKIETTVTLKGGK